MVARDFRGSSPDREDLFAATPPLEAKKAIFAIAAAQWQKREPRDVWQIMFIDVRKV